MLVLFVFGDTKSSDAGGLILLSLFLDLFAALWQINSRAVELLRSIEEIPFADCPIICRRRCVTHAINRNAGHFASATLLAILIGVRRKSQLHQATYRLGQARMVILTRHPCSNGSQQ